jgi:hypothetical protein
VEGQEKYWSSWLLEKVTDGMSRAFPKVRAGRPVQENVKKYYGEETKGEREWRVDGRDAGTQFRNFG